MAGRQKFVENDSALPRDRVYVNYSYFKEVPLVNESVNVHRATLGLEKTFLNGRTSFQIRIPTASSLSNDVQNEGGALNQFSTDTDAQFGNIYLQGKVLLAQTNFSALTAGTAACTSRGSCRFSRRARSI